jgi:hypothetical protein
MYRQVTVDSQEPLLIFKRLITLLFAYLSNRISSISVHDFVLDLSITDRSLIIIVLLDFIMHKRNCYDRLLGYGLDKRRLSHSTERLYHTVYLCYNDTHAMNLTP